MTLNDSGPLSSCDGIEVVTQAIIDYCRQGPIHATNYRNTPALNYSICNRYKHCSFCPVTLNDSGPLSSCDGIEVVTPAIIDYCSTCKDPYMLLTTGILQHLTTPFAIGTNTVLSVL